MKINEDMYSLLFVTSMHSEYIYFMDKKADKNDESREALIERYREVRKKANGIEDEKEGEEENAEEEAAEEENGEEEAAEGEAEGEAAEGENEGEQAEAAEEGAAEYGEEGEIPQVEEAQEKRKGCCFGLCGKPEKEEEATV